MNEISASHSVLERARVSRDSRFDGRFFVGVKTTGIYCRPICPVRLPRSENVLFFASAAAAQEEGFRPCLRCRPEVAPGTPAWRGTSALVSRALKLIARGAMDEGNTEELSDLLGVSERHLRRLFQRHLGASPAAVARTRRVHFAKQLIDETELPMCYVAFSSGFGSLRRFNSTIRSLYGRTPSQLRTRSRQQGNRIDRKGLTLQLPYRKPFDWKSQIQFLAPRSIPGVESVNVADESYIRSIELSDEAGLIEVRNDPNNSCLKLSVLHPDTTAIHAVVEQVRHLFDLFADPDEINTLLGRSSLLAESVKRNSGLRLPGCWDPFETTVRAILGQQINVAAATTLAGRLVARFGRELSIEGGRVSHLFPRPEALIVQDLQSLGMPASRVATLKSLATALREGKLSFSTDPTEVRAQLLAIPRDRALDCGIRVHEGFGRSRCLPCHGSGADQSHPKRSRRFGRQSRSCGRDLAALESLCGDSLVAFIMMNKPIRIGVS